MSKSWNATWAARHATPHDEIGLVEQEGDCWLQLQAHYDFIVYLGFSFWRKLIIMMSPRSLENEAYRRNPCRRGEMEPQPVLENWGQLDYCHPPMDLATLGRLCSLEPPWQISEKVDRTQLARCFGHSICRKYVPLGSVLPKIFLEERRPVTHDSILEQSPATKEEIAAYKRVDTDFGDFFVELNRNNHRDIISILVQELQLDLVHFGKTSLHFAAELGHSELVKFLLSKGAAVEAPLNYCPWSSPLFFAAKGDKLQIAKFLIEKGASASFPDVYQTTALHDAVSVSMAELLVSHGANVSAAGFRGYTPMHKTLFHQDPSVPVTDIVRFLLDNGADPNLEDEEEGSTLRIALGCRHNEALTLLIQAGANIHRVGGFATRNNVLDANALQWKNLEGLEILLKNGAKSRMKPSEWESKLSFKVHALFKQYLVKTE